VTIHQRRQALHRMTKGFGLQDAYDTTLDRIREQGGSKARLGMEALMWMSRCERPLRSQGLCHALGVELGAEDFSIQKVPSLRTILGYALGLVTIDEPASTPRLLYFTLPNTPIFRCLERAMGCSEATSGTRGCQLRSTRSQRSNTPVVRCFERT